MAFTCCCCAAAFIRFFVAEQPFNWRCASDCGDRERRIIHGRPIKISENRPLRNCDRKTYMNKAIASAF